MNKSVQILLLIALFPMIGNAREETLEERKQRIVRKYMRQSVDITQSDMMIPSGVVEDERIIDSEKYQDAKVSLQREDTSASPMMPPPQRPRPVPRADSNWLLGSMDETADASDPYADLYTDPYASSSIDSGEDLWSTWDTASETQASPTRQDRGYNPYAQTDGNRGMTDGRSQQIYSANGQQQNSGFGSSYSGRTGIFGQSRPTSGYNLQGNGTRSYGSDPSEGLLSSTYPQLDSSSEEEQSSTTQGYQPYKSPYVLQREQRSQQWGSQQQSTQEYKRQDSYQQFKDRNKTWNPTQDDAYINEMIQTPTR
ncbi:hypothetical protein P4C99_18985 [Pontiellaceae bacterium B1224]|nr:hypothetical protein [Pontiellaceae bacterium B1224]